jgi:putative tryptophan/tyrosine transport system substrate-binding protein
LVRANVAGIFAVGSVNGTLAAKEATATIPIVFVLGTDPVELGIVSSLNRPGGNLTGMMMQGTEVQSNGWRYCDESFRGRMRSACSPIRPIEALKKSVDELRAVANAGSFTLRVVPVMDERELEAAFSTFAELQVGAFMHTIDALFTTRYERIIELADRYRLPSIYSSRDSSEAGGLMNYGASLADSVRQGAAYAARILRGEKPADLPAVQPTRFELVINLKTAKALGLTIPEKLLATADVVIQ